MDISQAKQRLCAEVDRLAGELLDVSHRIHARPELGFAEHHAHDLLTEVLDSHGLAVQRQAYGVDTAFEARAGAGDGPVVAVVCEYDALPGIGHACGHNIIAASGLGAGPAHAAAAPEKGRNALDAAVLGYNAVAALRQHIRDDERIHGVFTDGGAKPNIVPATAASEWYVRSTNLTSLQSLKQRVITCLQAGADAACCEVDFVWADPPYADMNDNPALLERYLDNLGTLGRSVTPASEARVVGSTDMGNVSYQVPSIHPMIKVAPDDVPIHTPAFAEHARGPDGDAAVIDGAKALAMTAMDCWLDESVMASAQAAFAAS